MKKFDGFKYRSSCTVCVCAFLALIGLAVLSSSAFAFQDGDYTYTVSGGNATITGIHGRWRGYHQFLQHLADFRWWRLGITLSLKIPP